MHKAITISPKLIRSMIPPRTGVIDGGRILRFSCKPISGKKLRRILESFPNIDFRASFKQTTFHPIKVAKRLSGPLRGLPVIIEEYDSSWVHPLWEWFTPDTLQDKQKYTLLHIGVYEMADGSFITKSVIQRKQLIEKMRKWNLKPVNVPRHKLL